MNATMDRNKFFSKLIGQGKKDMLAVVNEMERNKRVWGYDSADNNGYNDWLFGIMETMEDWLSPKESLICFDVHEEDGNLKIVTKNTHDQYTLYRFFTLGNKWECSVDIVHSPESVFIKSLIQKI